MRFNPKHKGSVSVQIIKIAKLAVALGMAMILIAVETGKGLQTEITDKTVAFNGHLVVAPFENSESQISVRVPCIQILSKPLIVENGESSNANIVFDSITARWSKNDCRWQSIDTICCFLSSVNLHFLSVFPDVIDCESPCDFLTFCNIGGTRGLESDVSVGVVYFAKSVESRV